MLRRKGLLFFLVLLVSCFCFFTGCPGTNDPIPQEEEENEDEEEEGEEEAAEEEAAEEEEDEEGEEKQNFPVWTMKNLAITNGTKYLSLKTGKTVLASKRNTDEWDIAVAASMFVFRTNSGVTAETAGSPGETYIWYTDKTDFNSVTLADRVDIAGTEYEPYAQDVTRYSYLMDGTAAVSMNMMTYFGFEGGSGLTYEDPFRSIPRNGVPLTDYIFYHFNKKSAYKGTGGMPPGFKETGQIYIIRHADGEHYSKFQVTAFAYGYTMNLKFQQLE